MQKSRGLLFKMKANYAEQMENMVKSMEEEDGAIIESRIDKLRGKYFGKLLFVMKSDNWMSEEPEFSYVIGEREYLDNLHDMAQMIFNSTNIYWMEELK